MNVVMRRLRWLSLGAVLAYFYDPDRGRARRARARDQAAALTRRAGRDVEREGRYLNGRIRGLAATIGWHPEPDEPIDDHLLLDKVRSEALREWTHVLDAGVEGGIVTLHGDVPSARDATRILHRVRRVRGVRGVENALLVRAGPPVEISAGPARRV